MNKLRGFMAALLLMAAPAYATDQLWVFGDSLASCSYCWPEQIDDSGVTQVRNATQGGLSMLHFEVPQWLACQGGANYPTTKVVLALGGNDAIFGTPDEVFEQKAREHIIDLVEKGCDLTVIPPPDPIIGSQFDVPFNTKRTILEYVVAEFPTVNYYDMPYNWNSTTDGLHPSEVASFWIGYSIIQELGL